MKYFLSNEALKVLDRWQSWPFLLNSFCLHLSGIFLSSYPLHDRVLLRFFPSWSLIHSSFERSIRRYCRRRPGKAGLHWSFGHFARQHLLKQHQLICFSICKWSPQAASLILVCIYNSSFRTISRSRLNQKNVRFFANPNSSTNSHCQCCQFIGLCRMFKLFPNLNCQGLRYSY